MAAMIPNSCAALSSGLVGFKRIKIWLAVGIWSFYLLPERMSFKKPMIQKIINSSIWAVLPAIIFVGTIFAAEYHINKDQKNSAKFISDAKFESFEGVTDKVDGYVQWEGQQALDQNVSSIKNELYFEVLLESLDTGIGLRNRHMRENYLETDKFPYASYSAHITRVEKQNDSSFAITTEGKFSIHGVEKPMTIPGTVTALDNGYRVRANFEVKLTDFKIRVPSLMFLKINEIIKVNLDFYVKKIPDTGGK